MSDAVETVLTLDQARRNVDDAIHELVTKCDRCHLRNPDPVTPHKTAMTADDWLSLNALLFNGALASEIQNTREASRLLAALLLAIDQSERSAYVEGSLRYVERLSERVPV